MGNTKLQLVKSFGSEWTILYPENMDRNYDQFYLALEMLDSDPVRGKRGLQKLLKKNPNEHIDAYVHLGYYYYENLNQKLYKKNIEKAYSISESLLPKEFDHKKHKIPWGILSNRGFLRSFQAKGLLLMEESNIKAAIKIFKFLICVNPNDNQGIRYLLHDCYFLTGRHKTIITLFKKYPVDCSPEHYYGVGLIYLKQGLFEKAKTSLLNGLKYYPNIARDLLSNKIIIPHKEYSESHFGITSGEQVQVFEFKQRNFAYWKGTEGALDFLYDLIPLN